MNEKILNGTHFCYDYPLDRETGVPVHRQHVKTGGVTGSYETTKESSFNYLITAASSVRQRNSPRGKNC